MIKSTDNTFGCDNCKYLKGKRCTLWDVKVTDAHNSSCETGHSATISGAGSHN